MITIVERIRNEFIKHGAKPEAACGLVRELTTEHLAKINALLLRYNDDDNIHELLAEASSETLSHGCKIRCSGDADKIGFQLSKEEKEKLEIICERNYTTPSAFLRKVVQQLILGFNI